MIYKMDLSERKKKLLYKGGVSYWQMRNWKKSWVRSKKSLFLGSPLFHMHWLWVRELKKNDAAKPLLIQDRNYSIYTQRYTYVCEWRKKKSIKYGIYRNSKRSY